MMHGMMHGMVYGMVHGMVRGMTTEMEVDLQSIAGAVLARMRGEFCEMPGLKLTARQARRLWGLDAPVCDTLLHELVETGFLRRCADGSFVRADARP